MTTDKALDLALEALENNRRTHYYCEDTWYSCPKHEDGCANEAEGDECNCGADKANQEIDKAITAIKQARSAPAQEPVAFNAGVPPLYPEMKDGETISVEYTTPPAAQRPWVGLTDEEIDKTRFAIQTKAITQRDHELSRAIEAKLKEKNGLHRQHVTDGNPCWCGPETSYTDPETGASVIVHKEPQ
jgi:hypothetical protein